MFKSTFLRSTMKTALYVDRKWLEFFDNEDCPLCWQKMTWVLMSTLKNALYVDLNVLQLFCQHSSILTVKFKSFFFGLKRNCCVDLNSYTRFKTKICFSLLSGCPNKRKNDFVNTTKTEFGFEDIDCEVKESGLGKKILSVNISIVCD